MVGCFVLVDIIVLGTWQIVDPLSRDVQEFLLEKPKDTVEDIRIKPLLEHCESEYKTIFLGKFFSKSTSCT